MNYHEHVHSEVKKISVEYLNKLYYQNDLSVKVWSLLMKKMVINLDDMTKFLEDNFPDYYRKEVDVLDFMLKQLPDYCDKKIWSLAIDSMQKKGEELIFNKLKKKPYFDLLDFPEYKDDYFLMYRLVLGLNKLSESQIRDLEKTLPIYVKFHWQNYLDVMCQGHLPAISKKLIEIFEIDISSNLFSISDFSSGLISKIADYIYIESGFDDGETKQKMIEKKSEDFLNYFKKKEDFFKIIDLNIDELNLKI